MTNTATIHSRERLGWAFLLSGFAVFICIAISGPLALNAYLLNAKQPLPVSVQANQGTVRIDDETGGRRATLVGEPAEPVEPGANILTDATATALLLVYPPQSDQLLARLQVYGNTTVQLEKADAPQFEMSEADQQLEVALENGRLRLAIPEFEGRPFTAHITTPQGDVTIHAPGQYSLEVTNMVAQVAVQSGQATVSSERGTITLSLDQRAIISDGNAPIGPLDTKRNLVRNGDFNDDFEEWTLFAWNVQLTDQPEGEVNVAPMAGEPTLHIIRDGQGHADIKVSQRIDQDVTDYESLLLFLTFRVVGHSLDVCGILGSECPLFIRINYVEENGISRTWQQGFYGKGQVVAGTTPGACISCDVIQSEHEWVQLGQVKFYDVDIRAELARQGYLPPRFIESVSLISSGHSFEVEVVDVALMGKE